MYNFTFYVLYNYFSSRGMSKGSSKYNACLIISFIIVVHLGLIYTFYKKVIQKEPSQNQHYNSQYNYLFVFVIMIATYFFYNNKKIETILLKRNDGKDPLRIFNIIKVLLLLLVPLSYLFVLLTLHP